MCVQVLLHKARRKHTCPSCDCVINSPNQAWCNFEVTHGRLLWYTAGFSWATPRDAWKHFHTHTSIFCHSSHTHRHTTATPRGVVSANTHRYTLHRVIPSEDSVCVHYCLYFCVCVQNLELNLLVELLKLTGTDTRHLFIISHSKKKYIIFLFFSFYELSAVWFRSHLYTHPFHDARVISRSECVTLKECAVICAGSCTESMQMHL